MIASGGNYEKITMNTVTSASFFGVPFQPAEVCDLSNNLSASNGESELVSYSTPEINCYPL